MFQLSWIDSCHCIASIGYTKQIVTCEALSATLITVGFAKLTKIWF